MLLIFCHKIVQIKCKLLKMILFLSENCKSTMVPLLSELNEMLDVKKDDKKEELTLDAAFSENAEV